MVYIGIYSTKYDDVATEESRTSTFKTITQHKSTVMHTVIDG